MSTFLNWAWLTNSPYLYDLPKHCCLLFWTVLGNFRFFKHVFDLMLICMFKKAAVISFMQGGLVFLILNNSHFSKNQTGSKFHNSSLFTRLSSRNILEFFTGLH